MKQDVIKGLSDPELKEKTEQTQKELQSLKLTHAVSALPNPMEIRKARKTLARLKTEASKRELQKQ